MKRRGDKTHPYRSPTWSVTNINFLQNDLQLFYDLLVYCDVKMTNIHCVESFDQVYGLMQYCIRCEMQKSYNVLCTRRLLKWFESSVVLISQILNIAYCNHSAVNNVQIRNCPVQLCCDNFVKQIII